MNTLTLDYNASKALLFYMCYQKDIIQPKYLNDTDIGYYFFGLQKERDYLLNLRYDNYEKQILSNHFERFDCLYSLLTLYDRISISPVFFENSFDVYDFDKDQLADLGLFYNAEKLALPSKSILEDTITIMHIYEKEILAYYANDNASRYVDILNHYGFERYFEIKAYKDVFKESLIDKWKKRMPFYDIIHLGDFMNSRYGFDAAENRGFHYIDAYFLTISNALRNPRNTFYSSCISIPNMRRVDSNACKELNQYIVHAEFSKGLSIVPKAECYQDIVELRKDPNLQSFRSVFGEWIEYFVKGDIESFTKIKQDVVKANENLSKLKKYERVKNSPLYNVLSVFLGAIIPELSFALGGIGVVSSFAEPRIDIKNRWVNLPAFRGDMARYYRNDIQEEKKQG